MKPQQSLSPLGHACAADAQHAVDMVDSSSWQVPAPEQQSVSLLQALSSCEQLPPLPEEPQVCVDVLQSFFTQSEFWKQPSPSWFCTHLLPLQRM
jgi:hypothetical protein